jgi:hypothetical protein
MRLSRFPQNPYRLPQPPAPAPQPGSFLLVPLALMPVTLEQLQVQFILYRAALEEAQAVARPSLPERDLLGVWN